jgi:hypothetical protein
MISEPVECSAQTVHLSCTDTNTFSKRTKMRFHITDVTKVFHRVGVKRFLILWYVRCKPCTCLASRLALSLDEPKWLSTWASSPRCTIGCILNDFWAYGSLAQTVHLSCTDTNLVSKRIEMRFQKTHAPRSFIGYVKNDFRANGMLEQTMHLSWVKISTISKWTKTSFHLSLVT